MLADFQTDLRIQLFILHSRSSIILHTWSVLMTDAKSWFLNRFKQYFACFSLFSRRSLFNFKTLWMFPRKVAYFLFPLFWNFSSESNCWIKYFGDAEDSSEIYLSVFSLPSAPFILLPTGMWVIIRVSHEAVCNSPKDLVQEISSSTDKYLFVLLLCG